VCLKRSGYITEVHHVDGDGEVLKHVTLLSECKCCVSEEIRLHNRSASH